MIEVIMLHSPTCHACHATMPLMKMLEGEFRGDVSFRYISVAEPEYALRLYNSWEDYISKLVFSNFYIPIEEDVELSDEEKQEEIAKGNLKVTAMPTFIFRDTRYMFKFEVMIGGIGQDAKYEDKITFKNEIRKKLLLMLKKEYRFYRPSIMASQFPDWKYKRMFQNPFSEMAQEEVQ